MFAGKSGMRRPRGVVAIALVAIGLVVSACSGSLRDASSAARVNGQSISMAQYLTTSRLIFELQRAQASDPSGLATWQQLSGKASVVTAQQQALSVLVQNELLDAYAANPKNGVDTKQLPAQENAQLKQLFAQVPPTLRPLVDQGILTQDTYRPLLHDELISQAVFQALKVDTAHIRILTTKTKAQALDLMKQLNSDNWTELATKNSVDPAQSNGGDIAQLPQGVFPAAIDQAVFGPATTNPQTILGPIKSSMGYSLIQVVSRTPNVTAAQLDGQAPVFPGGQRSIQGAAFFGFFYRLFANSSHAINVNWCGNVSGKDCAALFPADQVSGS